MDWKIVGMSFYPNNMGTSMKDVSDPVQKGECFDCRSERRTCNIWGIIEGATVRNGDRTHIIIVNEDLGI